MAIKLIKFSKFLDQQKFSTFMWASFIQILSRKSFIEINNGKKYNGNNSNVKVLSDVPRPVK